LSYVDEITLMAEGVLLALALREAISAWQSTRPASVFCSVIALGMSVGALAYGMFVLALAGRPEGAMIARFPGQMPGMGAMFALVLGLPGGVFLALILTGVRWALNHERGSVKLGR